MLQWSGNTARRVTTAILCVGATGLCALGSSPPARSGEMTPAQTVAYRFPVNWGSLANRPSATGMQAASAAPRAATNLMFDPTPTYELASASSTPVILPERANAYADPAADGAAESRRRAANAEDR